MPADLAQQIPYIRRALEAYRIPILEAQGFEADDVIGTLARKAADDGLLRLRRVQRQGHDAVGQRSRVGAESAERQPHLRPRQGGGDSRRAAGARGGRDGPARRRRRQRSRRSRHRRQGIGRADPALRHRRERARPRRRSRAQDLSRVAAEQSRHGAAQQGAGHHQDRCRGGLRSREDAGAAARPRGRSRAIHRVGVQHADAGISQRGRRTRRDRLPRGRVRRGCRSGAGLRPQESGRRSRHCPRQFLRNQRRVRRHRKRRRLGPAMVVCRRRGYLPHSFAPSPRNLSPKRHRAVVGAR